MVEDRVTDGTRIAQLLASELSGREHGALAAVSVVDADPDVDPAPDGPVAYRIAVEGTVVATVRVYPEAAVVDVGAAAQADSTAERDGEAPVDVGTVRERARGLGLASGDGGDRIRIESGATVKRALDAVRAGL